MPPEPAKPCPDSRDYMCSIQPPLIPPCIRAHASPCPARGATKCCTFHTLPYSSRTRMRMKKLRHSRVKLVRVASEKLGVWGLGRVRTRLGASSDPEESGVLDPKKRSKPEACSRLGASSDLVESEGFKDSFSLSGPAGLRQAASSGSRGTMSIKPCSKWKLCRKLTARGKLGS
jgi:hypothetical protein